MNAQFRLTLAQLNPTVGAIAHNARLAQNAWETAKAAGADLLALTEMFITGYQTQDLVLKPVFVQTAIKAIHDLAATCADGPAMAIGGPAVMAGKCYNAYYILQNGAVQATILKHHLPNDAVFDEKRLFTAAHISGPYRIGPLRIGSPICEDGWHSDVAQTLAESGAEILLIPNGSPYHRGKPELRLNLMVNRVIETGLPLVYLNMVGGQDDQIFDGNSIVLNPKGELAVQLPQFESCITHVDFVETAQGWRAQPGLHTPLPEIWEADYHACIIGIRDYMAKSGFKKALIGLSGGIDSALVAAMAVDALGAENLHCVMLPSGHTSTHSLEDARDAARLLGCKLDELSITPAQQAVEATLAPLFAGRAPDVTEENIQSRLRGLLLMALSNKFGAMVLTTGNKSEMAVGYCTIYGDMNGGYNPLKDMYKTRVFATCRWRNAHHAPWMKGPAGMVIPNRIITKPPSAELRPDQTDQDSLPPYEVLDAILEGLVDHDLSIAELVTKGFDRATIKRIEHLLYTGEYKRFQSAPGPRLTPRAFWLDRRYPIVNGFRDEEE